MQRKQKKPWDIVFFDPPYNNDYLVFLREFAENAENLLAEDGVLVIEHHTKNALPDAVFDLRRWRILKQGETQLSFYERQ